MIVWIIHISYDCMGLIFREASRIRVFSDEIHPFSTVQDINCYALMSMMMGDVRKGNFISGVSIEGSRA